MGMVPSESWSLSAAYPVPLMKLQRTADAVMSRCQPTCVLCFAGLGK